jgi:hypothetical protein
MQPKKIDHKTLLGERGANLIAQIVMEMGYVWYPTGAVEAGIDGHIELRDPTTSQVFNTIIGVQSKATDQPFINETDMGFDYYCDPRDLAYWLYGNLPVLLIVSRPSTREAYWVSLKDYFSDPSRRSGHKVHFDKRENRFDTNCASALFDLAVPQDSGLYLAPAPREEQLLSNLLPLAILPQRIYIADTVYRDPKLLLQSARRRGLEIGGEWILRDKRIISFRDLRRVEWSEICDQGTVDDFPVSEWSLSLDGDRLREFVDLLRRALRQMVQGDLGYFERLGYFYFRATPDLTPRDIDYRSLAKTTDRTVFKAYLADNGDVKYYRHLAFHDRFHRFDGRWYLEITPTYHFTSDGYGIRPRYENFLKRIKQIEGHDAVRGQLLMWASFLCPSADLFYTEPYPFLGFSEPVVFDVDRGINDAAWEMKKSPERNGVPRALTTSPGLPGLFN